MEWYTELGAKMREYGVSRNDLAKLCGLDYANLANILKGRRGCSNKMRTKLEQGVEKLNPACKMTALYDYVRVRFPTQEYEHIMVDVLELKPQYFVKQDHGYYGYAAAYTFMEITILVSHEDDKLRGTLLELKGKGCRRYEYLLKAQSRTWNDFFLACLRYSGVFKRIDIAINDVAGILDIPEMTSKISRNEFKSIFTQFSPMAKIHNEYVEVEGSDAPDYEGYIYEYKSIKGNTLYIGSQRSDIYFCVYEKDVEQYIKEKIPLEDAETKNRFEIRLKNERAENAVANILELQDCEDSFEWIAFGIIERYFTLLEPDATKDKDHWPVDFRWRWFMGEGREPVRLTTKPEPYSLERSQRWYLEQVAPTVKLLEEYDKVTGSNIVEAGRNIRLPDKQQKILQQFAPNIVDAICLPGEIAVDRHDIPIPKPQCKTDEELSAEVQLRKAKERNRQLEREIEMCEQRIRAYKRILAARQLSVDDVLLDER